MAEVAEFGPVTTAKIDILTRSQREPAIAAMLRRQGRGLLRPVTNGDMQSAPPDVAMALSARFGKAEQYELGAVVTIRERALQVMPASLIGGGKAPVGPTGRLIVVDMPLVSEAMMDWDPPVHLLLLAAATIVVATTCHDPDARTFVACNTREGSDYEFNAIKSLCGIQIDQRRLAALPSTLLSGLDPDHLYFLTPFSAARAADHLYGLMHGSTRPTAVKSLDRADERGCLALLTVDLPRVLRALDEEIEAISKGRINIDWRLPSIANDALRAQSSRS